MDGVKSHYYVENTSFEARLPIHDPKTGALYPSVRQSLAAYESAILLLREWAVAPGTPIPTFGQPRIRLVAFERPAPDALDVPIGHERPIRVLLPGVHLYDAAGIPSLGPRRALRSVGKRSTVHLDLSDGPRWLVTMMVEGDSPVQVVREDLFTPRSEFLPVGGAVAAKLSPTLWERVCARASAYSSMRCRIRGDDQVAFCATFLAASPAEAARVLRLSGNPVGALGILGRETSLDAEARVEAFLSAVAAGRPVKPEWREAAREALSAADRLAALPESHGRTDAALCGVPVGIVEDFARIRTERVDVVPGGALPVWLPPGRYDLALTLPGDAPRSLPARLFEAQTADFAVSASPGGGWDYSAPLDLSRPELLRALSGSDPEDPLFTPFEAVAEITWSPVEHTLDAARTLRNAVENETSALQPTDPPTQK